MKVFGTATYLADLELPGALEAAFIRSPVPNARFEPPSFPANVFGAAELTLRPISVGGPGLADTRWPPLAEGRVRYLGEAVAVALAANRYLAEDLAESVYFDYRPVPHGDALHAEAPGGVLFHHRQEGGDVDAAFGRSARIFEKTFRTARQTARASSPARPPTVWYRPRIWREINSTSPASSRP